MANKTYIILRIRLDYLKKEEKRGSRVHGSM